MQVKPLLRQGPSTESIPGALDKVGKPHKDLAPASLTLHPHSFTLNTFDGESVKSESELVLALVTHERTASPSMPRRLPTLHLADASFMQRWAVTQASRRTQVRESLMRASCQ